MKRWSFWILAGSLAGALAALILLELKDEREHIVERLRKRGVL